MWFKKSQRSLAKILLWYSVVCMLEKKRNMAFMHCIPSHPKTSLTRCYRGWVFIWVFRGGALCQYPCCLTCDVFIKLDKLVQIHDPWCFHNATAFVNLKIERKWKKKKNNKLIIFLIDFFPKVEIFSHLGNKVCKLPNKRAIVWANE